MLLGVPTYLAKASLSDKQDEKAAVEAKNAELQSSIDDKADLKAQAAQVDQLDAQVTSLLATDVSWSHMLQDISKTMPGTVWLTSFQGAVTPAAPLAPAPAPATDTKADSEMPARAGSRRSGRSDRYPGPDHVRGQG